MTPQQIEVLKLALEAMKLNNKKWKSLADSGDAGCWKAEDQDHYKQTEDAITAIEKALAEHAMQEVQRLGQEIEPDDIASILACQDMLDAKPVPPRTEQEPVAHLWKCLGRWSAYLVSNGEQADCAPPSWLVDAVNNATTTPQRKPLTDEEIWDAYMKAPVDIDCHVSDLHKFARAIEAAHGIKENT